MAKYGMSMCVLGMHEELREDKIAVNALWPRTMIWTAAMKVRVWGGIKEGLVESGLESCWCFVKRMFLLFGRFVNICDSRRVRNWGDFAGLSMFCGLG